MSPSGRGRHQRTSFRVAVALDAAVPDGLEVLEAINVRVAPGRILIPDIAVLSAPGLDRAVYEPADVALVVEITGLGNVAADRALKPQLYAQAGIGYYLRIELRADGPHAFAHQLRRDHYVEVARAHPGESLPLTDPIPVTLDLVALSSATR